MADIEDGRAGIRNYLLELTPGARALLLGEFERRASGGDAEVETSVLLQELRALAEPAPRAGAEQALTRLVLRPLAPFTIDDEPARRHPGRIARASLETVWGWIGRELLPDQTAEFFAQAEAALADGENGTAEALAYALQDRIAAALRAVFAEDEPDVALLLAPLGLPHAAEDTATVRWVLRGRDNLAKLAAALPPAMDHLARDHAEHCLALIEQTARPRELFPYALVTVMQRLSAPWQIVRLGALTARSTSASRVAETPYGQAIAILLAELDRQLAELAVRLGAGDGDGAAGILRSIDAIASGLRREIDIPVASTLGRQLAGIGEEAMLQARVALASAHPVPLPLSA